MNLQKPLFKRAILGAVAAAAIAIGSAWLLWQRQTDVIPETSPPTATPVIADGFTLFDVGRQTILSQALLDRLDNQLGSHAVERRVPMDLSMNYPGFLEENFSALHALNLRLNPPEASRVEHNALKFTYRYARKKNIPFDYIELIFSGYSHTPTILKVRSKQPSLDLAETLIQKYGPAQTVQWTQKTGKTLWWQKKSDMLFLSEAIDRTGMQITEICIYYIDAIEKLLAAEQEETRRKETERRRKGETAL